MNSISSQSQLLAELILAVHVAIIGFNVFGPVAIPLGAWLRWPFARAPLWRWLHLASLAVVAAQAAVHRSRNVGVMRMQTARARARPRERSNQVSNVDEILLRQLSEAKRSSAL